MCRTFVHAIGLPIRVRRLPRRGVQHPRRNAPNLSHVTPCKHSGHEALRGGRDEARIARAEP